MLKTTLSNQIQILTKMKSSDALRIAPERSENPSPFWDK